MKCERCGKESVSSLLYCEHCGERRFKAKIRLVDRTGRDNTLYIFAQEYVIGRDRMCEIYLDDDAVSRRHARIYYADEAFFVEDLHSKNGLLLNGARVAQRRLGNFDCLQIGGATIHFYYSEGNFPEERIFTHTGEFVQATLLKISREIQSKNMLDEVLNTILDGIMAMTHSKEASLWLQEETGEWDLRLGRNLRLDDENAEPKEQLKRLICRISDNSQYYIYHTDGKQEFVRNLQSASGRPYRLLALPFLSRKLFTFANGERNVLGVVVLRAADIKRRLDERKIGLIESLASQAVVAIENSLLYTEALAKRKIDNELEVARKIQNRLLPKQIIQVSATDIAGYSRARNYVGGDYYDLLKVGETGLAIAISDISGKGLGAALVMSSLQGSLRAQISYETKPEQIVSNINQLFRESTADNVFATFFFALYDYATGTLNYVNAGHNPPFVVRKDGSEELLKSTSTVLGVFEEHYNLSRTLKLELDDVVVFYTDGLTDAMNEKMRPLGFPAVRETVRDYLQIYPEASAKDILDWLLKRVESHVEKQPQHDDLTLLVLRRTGPAAKA